jgi:hypothetical protein
MKTKKLYGHVVDLIITTEKVRILARGVMDDHPCGDGSILLVGEQDYDVEVVFRDEDVERIDPHVGHYQKATIYIKG